MNQCFLIYLYCSMKNPLYLYNYHYISIAPPYEYFHAMWEISKKEFEIKLFVLKIISNNQYSHGIKNLSKSH